MGERRSFFAATCSDEGMGMEGKEWRGEQSAAVLFIQGNAITS